MTRHFLLVASFFLLPLHGQVPPALAVEVVDSEGRAVEASVHAVPLTGEALRLPSGRLPILGRHDRTIAPWPDLGRGFATRHHPDRGPVRVLLPAAEEVLLLARRGDEVAEQLLDARFLAASRERPESVAALRRLTLEPMRLAAVRVLDAEGEGLEGVTVLLVDPSRRPGPRSTLTGVVEDTAGFPAGVTDATGRVVFRWPQGEDFGVGGRLEASVLRHGAEPVSRSFAVGGRADEVEIRLEETATVDFHFAEDSGVRRGERVHVEWSVLREDIEVYRPDKLGMIHVSWDLSSPTLARDWYRFGGIWYAEVGAEGRRQSGFRPGVRLGVTVEAEGRVARSTLVAVPDGAGPHRVELPLGPRFARVVWSVRTPEGERLAARGLRILPEIAPAGTHYLTREMEILNGFDLELLESGRFAIEVPPERAQRLRLTTRGMERLLGGAAEGVEIDVPALAPGATHDAGSFEITPDPVFLSGRVVDAEGAGAGRVRVRIRPEGEDAEGPGLSLTMRTDAEGRFLLRAPLITERAHRLTVRHRGRTRAECVVVPGTTGIVLRLAE